MIAPENLASVLLSNRYRVLNVLSNGGFGKTFLVEDTQMPSNRRCVLKQLKPVHDNPEASQVVKARFQREAAILETLGEAHEQIPRLYAYFSEGEQFYLVEEWVEGDTLTQKVQKEGPLSEQAVQNIIAGLLPAIAHVHQEGIVHRDIKPDNIILRASDGKPVLIDFGAVKEIMNTLIDSGAHSSHSIVVGTPGYMPAEQLSGRPVFASDIYAVGMTAIYALTGKQPQDLDLDSQTGVLQWRQYASGISPEFANFLDCAIHMNAQSRFSVVKEMHSILNSLILNGMVPSAQAMPETRQSSEATISALPSLASNPASNPAAAVLPTYAYQGVESAATQIVVPQALERVEPSSARTTAGAAPSPTQQTVQKDSGQWKNAVIMGGMVGFSVLLGALVIIDRFPTNAVVDSSGTAGVSAVDNTIASADGSTENSEQGASKPSILEPASEAEADNSVSAASNVTAQTQVGSAPFPAAEPRPNAATPQSVASAPGANSSIVGQSGSKNIRNGAGTSFTIVDSVDVGDRVKAVARNTDADGNPWYRVVLPNGNSGWVAGQLIQVDGDATPPQPVPQPQPVSAAPQATAQDNTNAMIVGEAGSKNIRSGPGTGYSIAHEAYPGDRVVIRESSKDSGGYTWYKIYFPKSGAEGWIASQLLRLD